MRHIRLQERKADGQEYFGVGERVQNPDTDMTMSIMQWRTIPSCLPPLALNCVAPAT